MDRKTPSPRAIMTPGRAMVVINCLSARKHLLRHRLLLRRKTTKDTFSVVDPPIASQQEKAFLWRFAVTFLAMVVIGGGCNLVVSVLGLNPKLGRHLALI
ncbi:unnamed protein product [Prunus armeniaca]|uniref:Uncharacterized protein n=1 Tax=Prunus armeniaca TaxID=36596 RepID=A0A6J5U011_PRUAR|nr:unnamed protein product [Prunus armeniaca]